MQTIYHWSKYMIYGFLIIIAVLGLAAYSLFSAATETGDNQVQMSLDLSDAELAKENNLHVVQKDNSTNWQDCKNWDWNWGE